MNTFIVFGRFVLKKANSIVRKHSSRFPVVIYLHCGIWRPHWPPVRPAWQPAPPLGRLLHGGRCVWPASPAAAPS